MALYIHSNIEIYLFLHNRLRKYSENAFSLHAMCKYIQKLSKIHYKCWSRKLDKLSRILEFRRTVHLHYLTYITDMICCSYSACENVMTVRVYMCQVWWGKPILPFPCSVFILPTPPQLGCVSSFVGF